MPYAGLAEDSKKSTSITEVNPIISHSNYSTQDDLQYIYGLYDEGLMDSKDLYKLGKMIDEIASNPRRLNIRDFDAIDFEIYAKGLERINIH
jgi:hypothetical protein